MAMHEIFLENDKPQESSKRNYVQSQLRFNETWHDEKVIVNPEHTPLHELKDQIERFNELRERAGDLAKMFMVVTFQKAVIEKLMAQDDAYGLRLYLSYNQAEDCFMPLLVGVNKSFEDIISQDDKESEQAYYAQAASRCPPPEPASSCPKNLLLLPQKLIDPTE